jgi:hypothetical protein
MDAETLLAGDDGPPDTKPDRVRARAPGGGAVDLWPAVVRWVRPDDTLGFLE